MEQLFKGFEGLIRVGVNTAHSPRSQFQTRAANLAGVAFALLSLPYVPLEYALGARGLALATLISCFVFPLSIPLNYFGFSRLARAVPTLTGTVMAWTVSLAVSTDGQVQVVLFMMGLWAFALYDARTEWMELLILQLIPAGAYFSLTAGWQPIQFDWKPGPDLVSTYAVAMPTTTFVLNSVFLFLFYRRNLVNEDRLVQAVAELEEAHQAARAGEQAKAEFLAVMSHEFRTPLNGLLGCAQLMAQKPLETEQKQHLETLTASAESLLDFMAAILDYTQLDNGRARLIEASVDPAGLVDDAVESFADAAAARRIRLWFRPDPSVPPTLRLDPGRLRLIVASLVGNAVKFTKGGHVAVGLRYIVQEGKLGTLELSVSDTGKGIPTESHEAIFEHFHQLDRFSERLEGGMGLGLAIARATAELMKGKLDVESIPEIGSRFTLSIPTRNERPSQTAEGARPGAAASVRVDVEETEHAVALEEKLERWGHRIVSLGSGERADVLLVDQRRWEARAGHGKDFIVHAESRVVVLSEPELPLTDGMACVSWYLRRGPWLSALSSFDDLPTTRELGAEEPSATDSAEAEALRAQVSSGGARNGRSVSPKLKGEEVSLLAGRVLIAEDHPMSQKVLKNMASLYCEEIHLVKNGREAVEAWENWEPDVILMDVQMPLMDGLEATRTIRMRETTDRRTPIIAITANALPEQKLEGLAAGVDVYLTKPLRLVELRAALEKVRRASES